ncbi:pyrroline-5-carboxylate reductase [Endozoicomonas sp. (ex Bugula neritina AB1)]|nr:pyrroline-5-carboxylate reductase [Endozoicomonas sp. (ex Bugula neritina AB1)]
MTDTTIAFIGSGNMASSIIGGLINNGWPADNIIATGRTQEKLDVLRQQLGVTITLNNREAVAAADIVILGVKPQGMEALLSDLSPSLDSSRHLIISVAAGISMVSLEQWVGSEFSIVRSMPNTPALVQCGATGLYANKHTSESQKQLTNTIFNAIGISEWVPSEDLIDAVIAVSGSSPAYYFLFMESIIKAGIELGLDAKTSERLALQTALGAARMAVDSDTDVAELRRRVTSPNGTTEQAIQSFQRDGLEEGVSKAMSAAVNRAREMSKELA